MLARVVDARCGHTPSQAPGRHALCVCRRARSPFVLRSFPPFETAGTSSAVDYDPQAYVRRCGLCCAAAAAGGARCAPLAARLRALRVAPLVPPRALLLGPNACTFMCRSQTDNSSSTDVRRGFTAESDRARLFLGSSHDLHGLLGSPGDVLRGGRSRLWRRARRQRQRYV